ncbi:hypothetical protein [Pedosphaera parvula]|uniref:Uncharacterized protein n=1 Tax=Pedosphaera parvula (strain Ellin514) TaxID=320771 RepID=B9XJQ1_PEDPL|nr:hypothetical protein [Pedosphaera parvula]EEF59927.1 conserved hypothetical protein [Pedosphaera parvula Ellin514]
MKTLFLLLLLFCAHAVFAQPFSIDWYKIAGGGGRSSGGLFEVNGTIGQHDASTPMSGGNFSLTGGFWALSAVQTVGAPTLFLTQSGNNVVLSWAAPAPGFVLESNSSVTASNSWLIVSPTPVSTNGFNYVTNLITPGNKFYRLQHP